VRLNGSPTHSDLTSEFTSGWVSGDSSHPSHYSETRLGVTLANDSTAHRPTSTVESECLDSTKFVTSFSSHYFFRRSPHISFVLISAFLLVPLHWYDHLESLLTVPSREPNKVMSTVTASPISPLEFTPHLEFGRQKSAPVFSISANEATAIYDMSQGRPLSTIEAS
jgi:hypothetical protein